MKYIGILVALVIVVGGGYYLYTNMPAPMAQEENLEEENQNEQGEAVSGSGTFAELVAQGGGNYECAVSMTQESVTSQGVVYIASTNVRADFTSTVAGQTVGSSMIQTGGFVYTWSDMTPQGFKMSTQASAAGSATTGGFDPTVPVTYDCQPWPVDSSKFEIPEAITFVEVNLEAAQ